MEGRVAILLLLLVWQNTFLHLGKFGDILWEENGPYICIYSPYIYIYVCIYIYIYMGMLSFVRHCLSYG